MQLVSCAFGGRPTCRPAPPYHLHTPNGQRATFPEIQAVTVHYVPEAGPGAQSAAPSPVPGGDSSGVPWAWRTASGGAQGGGGG